MIAPRNVFISPAIVALYVASMPAPALASEPVTVRGRIGQINAAAGHLTLEPVGGRNVVLTVTADSRLEARGKATPLVRFDKGQWMRATVRRGRRGERDRSVQDRRRD